MFSEKDLQSLLDYSTESQVVSLYLNTDPTEINTEAAKLRLRNLLKTVDLPEDVQAIENFVSLEYDWAAKGLTVFSDQAADFFQAHQFNISTPNAIFVGKHPTIRPLVRLMDAFTGWGVVLVDKEGARFFSYDLGELGEVDDVTGEDVKQLKRGGGNAMPGRMGGADMSSKIEHIINQNIKEVISEATEFFEQHHIRRIMIGGTDDNIARFMEELPKSWHSLVVGEFPMSMIANLSDVWEQAKEEALAAQKKIYRSLADQAVTLAAKGSNGVTGLIDTLNAIHEGRVRILLVVQDFEAEGYRCKGCGYLTVQELDTCPFCGDTFETIDAAVEMAVREALKKSADVKVMSDVEALEKAGNIAAILRY